jgi:organic radical activating enzyme
MKINEIFYSLQGEGFYSGTPAIFIRFSGCNLRCPFCDTQHESGTEMTEEEIVSEVEKYPARHVVVTGGEPALQLTASLVDKLHAAGKYVAVETNGTRPLPENVDWITLSPKDAYVDGAQVVLPHANEVKVVYDGEHAPEKQLYAPSPSSPPCREGSGVGDIPHFLQPCDTGDAVRNAAIVQATVDYVKRHPEWRLSLQIHKILNIR